MLRLLKDRFNNVWHGMTEKLVWSWLVFHWSFFFVRKLPKRDRSKKPRLMFGPMPILSNKYWAEALREAGYEAKSVMNYDHFAAINNKEDFDVYLSDLFPPEKGRYGELRRRFKKLRYLAEHFDILHGNCIGFALGDASFMYEPQVKFENYYDREFFLLSKAGCKIVTLPYGGDVYRYSKVLNLSLRHALQVNYPRLSRTERKLEARVQYWVEHADIFLPVFQVDGIGRWDLLPFSYGVIDERLWESKKKYSAHDGKNGLVTLVHTPNHRGVKGTEFLVKAVEELKAEGLQINFILLEKKKNSEVRRILFEEADILVEQLIGGAYALSGIEGMCTGLPVVANLEVEEYTRIFRRYSYLNECPAVSATPENVREVLRLLIRHPALREELGRASRKYVEKYHSYAAMQYMFSRIYERIWYGREVDLMNMYHPLDPASYNNQSPVIKHPLRESRITEETLKGLSAGSRS